MVLKNIRDILDLYINLNRLNKKDMAKVIFKDIQNELNKTSEEFKDKITKEDVDNLVNLLFRFEQLNKPKEVDKIVNIISPFIDFVDKKNWMECSFCSDFYDIIDGRIKLDIREMAFCCNPSKNCPFRFLTLSKLKLNEKDYKKIKTELGGHVLAYIRDYNIVRLN